MPVISTNLAANSAVRYLNINSSMQTSSLSKLASGSRITQASDDAAGLAISTKISSDVTALNQAATNASHGISVLQTADGGASNISDILQRMKALASQASSGTVTDNERVYIDAEFQQLIQEVDAISVGTRYNGQSLLDGSSAFAGQGVNVMVGSDAADVISVKLDKLTAQGLRLASSGPITAAKGTDAVAMPDGAAVIRGLVQPFYDAGADGTLSFDINGATITMTPGGGFGGTGQYGFNEFASAINGTPGAGVVATLVPGTFELILTSVATGKAAQIKIDNFTGGTGTEDGSIFGFAAAAPFVQGSGTTPPTAATFAGTAAGYTATQNVSFDINGTTVTLKSNGGSEQDGVYSAQDLVDAINLAAPSGVTATLHEGGLRLVSTETGADAEILLDNFENGTAESVLGISTDTVRGTTGAPAGPNIPATLTIGAAALINVAPASNFDFEINGLSVALPNPGPGGLDFYVDDIYAEIIGAAGYASANFTVSQAAPGGDIIVTQKTGGTGNTLDVTLMFGMPMSGAEVTAFDLSAVNADGIDGIAAIPAGDLTMLVGSAGLAVPSDGSTYRFEINGATVILDADADANGDATWSATEIADAINTSGIANITATGNNGTGAVVIKNADAAGQQTVIKNFVGSDGIAVIGANTFGLTAATVPVRMGRPGIAADSQVEAVTALGVIDKAISTVSRARANIGSLESRFGFHQASIATSVENLTAAVSAIRDTDVAQEAAKLASSKVKTQAAVAAAAQASQMPQDLLKLLQ